jgi:hypothetical protein
MRWNVTTLITLVLVALCATVSAQVVPTSQWIAVWSDATLHESVPVEVGSVVQAFDPDGVLCGQFTVTVAGTFGLMAVYRDDPSTTGIDEGAWPGDPLRFTIDSVLAYTLGPDTAIWTANGATLHVDLDTSPVPVEVTTWGRIKALFD